MLNDRFERFGNCRDHKEIVVQQHLFLTLTKNVVYK